MDPDTTIEKATNINYIDATGKSTPVEKVDMGKPGQYNLGYTYTDAAGNKAMARRIVYVIDRIKPVVYLNGVEGNKTYAEEEIKADKTATYEDKGARVTDNVDPDTTIEKATNINYIDATGKSIPVEKVDMGKPGQYNLGYTYTDAAGNKAMARRIVYVIDRTKPVVYLNGVEGNKTYAEETIEADKTATYEDKGARVTDNVDPDTTIEKATNINYIDATGKPTPVEKVDMGKPGQYNLGYTYTDAAGNKAMARRIVKVLDRTAPVITLNGEQSIIIKAGIDTYEELGAKVTDNVDETIENLQPVRIHYSVNGKLVGKVDKVDTSKPGTYKVVYEYTDKAGKKGVDANRTDHTYVIRTVTVVDATPPTATVTASNDNGMKPTNKDVTVTLVASEPIKDIEDWERVNETTFTKVYSDNIKTSVEIEDMSGNKSKISFEVKRIDKVAPKVTVKDPNKYPMEINTEYVEKGYSAYDVVDKDVTNRVTMKYQFQAKGTGTWSFVDKLDTSRLGTYKITYIATDKAGNEGKGTRVVQIVDTTKPLIKLNGNPKMNVEVGKKFEDPGVTIVDNSKEDIKATLTVYYSQTGADGTWIAAPENRVNNLVVGYYNIWYTATDSSGNSSSVRRTVEVEDTVPPEIKVSKNITSPTKKSVTVTITANEMIQLPNSDWKYVDETKTKIKKVYRENTAEDGEEVFIKDLYGNSTKVTVKIINIDKTAPTAKVEYSTRELTNGKVIVTLTASEPIILDKTKSGTWAPDDGKYHTVYKKVYPMNAEQTVIFTDKVGNEGSAKIKITNIDTTKPVITLNGEKSIILEAKNTYEEKGATVTDNVDADKTISKPSYINLYTLDGVFISRVDKVDTSRVGRYNLVYTAKDTVGNEATKVTRIVYVKEAATPEL